MNKHCIVLIVDFPGTYNNVEKRLFMLFNLLKAACRHTALSVLPSINQKSTRSFALLCRTGDLKGLSQLPSLKNPVAIEFGMPQLS